MSSFLYYEDYDEMEKETRGIYRAGTTAFEGIAPEYHIELKERPTMVWDFYPQLLTIQMMFVVGWSVMLSTIDYNSLQKYLFEVQP